MREENFLLFYLLNMINYKTFFLLHLLELDVGCNNTNIKKIIMIEKMYIDPYTFIFSFSFKLFLFICFSFYLFFFI